MDTSAPSHQLFAFVVPASCFLSLLACQLYKVAAVFLSASCQAHSSHDYTGPLGSTVLQAENMRKHHNLMSLCEMDVLNNITVLAFHLTHLCNVF